jgi:hypothetical protein
MRLFVAPFTDLFAGLQRSTDALGGRALPLLLVACAAGWRPGAASTLLFDFALPIAWAPLLSVTGDFYELGAIAASRAAAIVGVDGERWRGDDIVAIVRRQFGGAFSWFDAAGVTASLLLGIVLAFATYAAGRAVAAVVARRGRPT